MQSIITLLGEMADNWMLVAMVTCYLGTIVWALRPGARATHDEIANTVFRNETLQEREAE